MSYLITGASGFLGSIIYEGLADKHKVVGLGRSQTNDVQCDLSASVPALGHYYVVIHCAGLAHLPGDLNGHEFDAINVTGTRNLLSGLTTLPKMFIFISTVAVYGANSGVLISEESPLNGTTPYAKSKIEAEKIVEEWAKRNEINYLILRLPLIYGKNAPGNLAKMIKGIKSGLYFSINKGSARRSMVLASDIAGLVANFPMISGTYNLTDGYHPSFQEMEIGISRKLGVKRPLQLPTTLAKILAWIGDHVKKMPFNSEVLDKMSSSLTFDDSKARKDLNWSPGRVLENL